jgi:hypothetical protein
MKTCSTCKHWGKDPYYYDCPEDNDPKAKHRRCNGIVVLPSGEYRPAQAKQRLAFTRSFHDAGTLYTAPKFSCALHVSKEETG